MNGRTMWSREEINSLQMHAVTLWSTVNRFLAIGLFVLATGSAYAQGGRATISGSVSDPTGAIIAGAHISAKNLETGQITAVTTGSEGNYSLPFLPIGRYEITVSNPG